MVLLIVLVKMREIYSLRFAENRITYCWLDIKLVMYMVL
jgi:hypothetical protein